MATTATTWTARDPYSKPRRPPALERGATASLSLRQDRDEAWALQPRSRPTDVACKAAGLPQGSTLPPGRPPKGWAALGGLTRPTRASRGPGSATGRTAPQDTPGRLAVSCRPEPTRGSHPAPPPRGTGPARGLLLTVLDLKTAGPRLTDRVHNCTEVSRTRPLQQRRAALAFIGAGSGRRGPRSRDVTQPAELAVEIA